MQAIISHETIGIELPESMTKEEWRGYGLRISQVEGALNWVVGDWLVRAKEQWFGSEKGMYHDAENITGWTKAKLKSSKMTSARFSLLDRSNKLSWTHHRDIAGYRGNEADDWLNRCLENNWSVQQLREAISAARLLEAEATLGYTDDPPPEQLNGKDLPLDDLMNPEVEEGEQMTYFAYTGENGEPTQEEGEAGPFTEPEITGQNVIAYIERMIYLDWDSDGFVFTEEENAAKEWLSINHSLVREKLNEVFARLI